MLTEAEKKVIISILKGYVKEIKENEELPDASLNEFLGEEEYSAVLEKIIKKLE